MVIVLPDAANGPAPEAAAPTADGDNCGISRNDMDRLPADLLIVQDRSGTMRSKSKWDQVTSAVNAVVGETESVIRWGLKLYAMPYESDTAVRCYVPDNATVPLAFGNAAAISASLAAYPPTSSSSGSATPTRWAIDKALAYLQSVNDGYPKYMLLATDGLPNCKSDILGTDDYGQVDEDGAVNAVAAAAAAGVPVYVVGIDIGGGGDTLDRLAVAGGRAREGDIKYYPAEATTGLVEALQAIVGNIPTCSFTLAAPPPVPENIAVDAHAADGGLARIPKDPAHAAGWDYADATSTAIQIYGSWCDQITSGQIKSVEAIFGCPGIPIP